MPDSLPQPIRSRPLERIVRQGLLSSMTGGLQEQGGRLVRGRLEGRWSRDQTWRAAGAPGERDGLDDLASVARRRACRGGLKLRQRLFCTQTRKTGQHKCAEIARGVCEELMKSAVHDLALQREQGYGLLLGTRKRFKAELGPAFFELCVRLGL